MFMGVIQEIGTLQEKEIKDNKINLEINSKELIDKLENGDEVSIDGICLTVTKKDKYFFSVEGENINIQDTNLHYLKKGDLINLEKETPPYKYKGNHVISGIINNIGEIINIKEKSDRQILKIKIKNDLHDYIKENNSIAINGVSLNIKELIEDKIIVEITNSILENTSLSNLKKGEKVNIETDIVGRYMGDIIEKHVETKKKKEIIEKDLLKKDGFI